MLFVVDFNVIFSALVNKGESFRVFRDNALSNKFEFIAPELLSEEIKNNKDKLLSLTKLTNEEFNKALLFILKQIKFVSSSKFLDKLSEAIELNPKDSPYLALALKFNCPIFSGDKELKEQTKVKVFSPREMLDIIESNSSPEA